MEKISDKGKNPPDKLPGVKKEVDPAKFRRYVEKVEETNPDERKKRRMGQEAEQENASGASYQKKMPARPNADKTAPDQKAQGDFTEHYDTDDTKEVGQTEKSKQAQEKKKKEKTSAIGMPAEKITKEEKAKKEASPFFEPIQKAKNKEKKEPSKKTHAKKPTQRTREFDLDKIKAKASENAQKKAPTQPTSETKQVDAKKQKELDKLIKPSETVAKEEKAKLQEKIASPSAVEKTHKDLKKEKTDGIAKSEDIQITPIPIHELDNTPVSAAAPLSPPMRSEEVSRLISHMVSQITAVAQKGETHTTITLTGGAFQGSVFYGSQIVIKESSTAQRVYNIELYGATPEAKTLFENYAGELLQTFQSKQYPFSVHRVETGNRHAIRRKKGAGKEKDMGS